MKTNMNMMRTMAIVLATPPDLGQRNVPDVIYAANEDRFDAVNLSQPLTTFALGWDVPNLQAKLDQLFPGIPTPRRFEYNEFDNSEAFLSELDDERGIGAEFKVIETGGKAVTVRTRNKGLTIRLDREQMVPGEEERAVQRLMTRVVRNDLRRGFVALVAAAGTIEEKTWGSNANPDSDIRAAMRAGFNARGLRSDVVLFTGAALDKRADAYEAQNTPAAGVAAQKTVEQLAGKYRCERVMEFDELYTTKVDGAKTNIAGDDYVITYMAPLLQSRTDPSNVKRFYTPFGAGANGQVQSGGKFWVYREERTSFVDITVAHNSTIVIPSSLGIKALKIK